VVIAPERLSSLEARDAAIAAARSSYREAMGDLDAAVAGDCYAALMFAHHTPE
jgi:hypothetical protein